VLVVLADQGFADQTGHQAPERLVPLQASPDLLDHPPLAQPPLTPLQLAVPISTALVLMALVLMLGHPRTLVGILRATFGNDFDRCLDG
jgi:hypothetical protein